MVKGAPSEGWAAQRATPRSLRLLVRALFVVLIGILILGATIPSVVWQATNVRGVFGDQLIWNDDESVMFASARGGIIAASPQGASLVRRAVVSHQFLGGSIGYGDGWLYFVSDGSYFMALDVSDLGAIVPHGPFRLGEAIGDFVKVYKILVRDGIALLGGYSPFPTDRGVIVALNVSDPASITIDPSTLHVLYWLYFDAGVADIAIQGSSMYVIRGGGHLDVFDLTVSPPEFQTTYLLGGALAGLDVQGDLLAVTDGDMANKTVLFYQVSGSQISFLSRAVLAGQPTVVSLESNRAYVSWHPDDNFDRGLAVFDLQDVRAPRLVYRLATRDFGGNSHLVSRGTAYLLGLDDTTIVREAAVPSIFVDSLPQTILVALAAVEGVLLVLYWVKGRATTRQRQRTDWPPSVERR